MLGTDDKYLAYRKKVDAAKAAMKGGSKEQHDAIEKKMLEEVEAEGLRAEAAADGTAVKVAKQD